MALFRNYSDDGVSQCVSDEKIEGKTVEIIYGVVGNKNVEATSSDKDCEIRMDSRYRIDDEPNNMSRIHDDAATENAVLRCNHFGVNYVKIGV
ncbi:hypothetical protein Vadar_005337 [Vaccinium darrowii]|uniref:Uncharacterized protein n=1 Tax=Vaccinium darrowii TaxID=229202 RepID=A0ACB7WY00_9ERIC|nr:hypothetical protein Vadar_005337 [Vaccinium darrowii]